MLGRWLARALVASGARQERRGDLAAAGRRYRRAAALAPRYAPAWLNLGGVLEAAGNAEEARCAYASLHAADPANPFAAFNLARLHHARGALGEAARLLGEALAAKPDFPDALVLLAAIQEARGEAQAALASLRRALELRADHAGTWLNYADLAWRAGQPDEAERALRRVLELAPQDAFACFQVARLEQAAGRLAQAEALLARAVAARPDFTDARSMHAGALLQLERLDEAEDAARRALAVDPSSSAAAYTLGLALRNMGRIGEARAALADAVRLAPERLDLEPAELLVLTLADDVSAEEAFARHRDWGARLEAAVPPLWRSWRGAPDPERRLRLGFVSCDFNRHPVSWFLLPLLERFDRARVESVCYDVGGKSDEVTAQVRAAADHWREARPLDDEALARAIEADAIDVLVDLTGHAGAARLGAFARQPAPVQASWLGYLHSTGLKRIAWRITDARADPPGASEALHTERLARLPNAQWCFRPAHLAGHAQEPPMRRKGHVTFGSFNHAPKLSPAARRLWARVLAALPGARLVMVGIPEGRVREALRHEFRAAGIDDARLELVRRLPFAEYLRQFDEVDVALDSLPYGGGTTTFDALWMGVPVLTLAGDRSASRSAASILGALGLEDWIARSEEEFVRLALAHASDAQGLAALRARLRARLRASALMDEPGFARDMEALLRGLWREWCARPIP